MTLIFTKRFVLTASLLAVAACSQSPAATNTKAATPATSAATMKPADVVQKHVNSMKTGKLDDIMSDYADDTVVITPPGLVADQTPPKGPGVYVGKADAQKVFATITKNLDAVKGMETSIEPKGDDVAFLHWVMSKGKPDEATGTDVFVVRNDKIVMQDIVLDAK